MEEKIDWHYQFSDRRAVVYLVWAILVPFGFLLTHFYQKRAIDLVWLVISIIGLGFMAKLMPLKDKRMRSIFAIWLITIGFGMFISIIGFHVFTPLLTKIMVHLGGFWLIVMGYGYFFNGLVDKPSTWYWFATVLNITAGLACFFVPSFTENQYLVAAVISAWSMLYLWIFRSADR